MATLRCLDYKTAKYRNKFHEHIRTKRLKFRNPESFNVSATKDLKRHQFDPAINYFYPAQKCGRTRHRV